jgi:hypothetical protein
MARLIVVLVLVTVSGAWYLALPPRGPAQDPPSADPRQELRGAIHVHTTRSDGTGTVQEVAAAAARAGLDFLVLTDHGDGTREPDPPQYRDGVLCIDAVEISTYEGHLLALGMPQAPYPIGGEARDVVEDVRRLGGFTIAAHPVSNKPELDWRDWSVPLDGLEWLNGDSEWRDESAWSLARALFTYPARRVETLASLLDRPAPALRQWDALAQQRKVVAVAGADAHARIGLRGLGEPYENSASLRMPGYERMFRLFSNVIPALTLGGDPAADAAAVLAAIRGGRLHSQIDALGGGGAFTFTAATAKGRAGPGEVIPVAGPVAMRVEVHGPPEARIDLWKDGMVIATGGGALDHAADAPGVYRVEVWRPDAPGEPPVPWIVSNPIWVGREPGGASPPPARRAPSAVMPRYTNGPAAGWTIEASPSSLAALDVVNGARGTELAFRYAIGGAASASPFAALLLAPGPDLAGADRILFTARADRPMRLSVQVREPAGEADHRWQRSVYLDTAQREIAVDFADLRPVGTTPRDLPPLASIDAVMFVIDTVNTPLGGSGRIWIDDVRYAR